MRTSDVLQLVRVRSCAVVVPLFTFYCWFTFILGRISMKPAQSRMTKRPTKFWPFSIRLFYSQTSADSVYAAPIAFTLVFKSFHLPFTRGRLLIAHRQSVCVTGSPICSLARTTCIYELKLRTQNGARGLWLCAILASGRNSAVTASQGLFWFVFARFLGFTSVSPPQ